MNKKLKKIIKKIPITIPMFLISLLAMQFVSFKTWELIAIGSIVASLIYLFSNIFDYDYFDDIDLEKDYLESTHSTSIPFTEEGWELIQNITDIVRIRVKNEVIEDSFIKYEIIQKRFNSIIEFSHVDGDINVRIEKKLLKNVPDKAVNYVIYRKLRTQLRKL